MQCYHINFLCIQSDIVQGGWYTNANARSIIRQRLERTVHFVMAEKSIRRLKFTLPCLQTLPIHESTIPDETQNVDFLSPLKYLRVAEPVIFEFINNTDLSSKSKDCDCCKCQDMLRNIHAKYRLLQGEELSLRDKKWIDVLRLEKEYRFDAEIWDRVNKLNAQHYDMWGRDIDRLESTFDEYASETMEFIQEKHRKWDQQRSTRLGAIKYDMDWQMEILALRLKALRRR
ncbi:MAG: hypothetical protein Q9226_009352 [Calogaya cf. arnoldii]